MRSKKGKAKKRLDAFYDLAKRQGYRARSAFKLIQLNRKYDFFKNCSSVIDLCAAPGGWMQVAKQFMPPGGTIIGVDLDPIKGLTGCKAILGDIYSDRTKKDIKNSLKAGKADVVLHDGSPNVGGVWIQEVFSQHQLVLQALKLSTEYLDTGGWFITKVFRSENFNCLIWVFKQLFKKVEATKPVASRAESSEIYVICHGYKNPHRVDPKFFKVSEVFKESDEKDSLSVLAKKNLGNSNDVTRNLHCRCSANDFITSIDALQLVKEINEIHFQENNELDKRILESTFTTKEILHICSDVKQASAADIKRLLRWKEKFFQKTTEKELPSKTGTPTPISEANSDDILAELDALRKKTIKQQKKKMRKIVDRKLKHLGKVIHHDPVVVENIGQSESTNGNISENQHRFVTEMPGDSDTPSEESNNLDDEYQPKVNETIVSANDFHATLRGMLSDRARTICKSKGLTDNPHKPDSLLDHKKKARTSLQSHKKIGEIVNENLRNDEISLVKKRKRTSQSELTLLDPSARAKVLAMATDMLIPKKRSVILEDSINKHTRGEEDLPDWFVEDEKKHYYRPKPITREAIEFQKQRFQEVNVRPSKKVAEAISRKRRKASKILRKVQKKGQTDPRMKEKGQRLSIRSLMRSKTLNKIKSKPMDNKMKGELYRNRQRNRKK